MTWAVEEARSRDASLQVVICQPVYAEVHAFGAGPAVHGADPSVATAVTRHAACPVLVIP